MAGHAGDFEKPVLGGDEMIYRSRRRMGELPQRWRNTGFYAVDRPKSAARRRADLLAALDEIEAKFGVGTIKRGDECGVD